MGGPTRSQAHDDAGRFFESAFNTSYAMIVPEKQLARANGMMQTTDSLSGILALAIAATLISLPALSRQGLLPGIIAPMFAQWNDGTPIASFGAVMTLFCIAQLFNPYLLRVEDREWLEDLAAQAVAAK